MRAQAYFVELARETSLPAAVLYNQLLYWADKGHREDGWVYKTYQELEQELGISEKQLRTAYGKLEAAGYIETAVKQMPNGLTAKHFRVLRNCQKVTSGSDEREDSMGTDQKEVRIYKQNITLHNNTYTHRKDAVKGIRKTENKEVTGIVNYWHQRTKLPEVNKRDQRRGAAVLLKTFNYQETRALIDAVTKAYEDKYAPKEVKCTTLMELARNKQKVLVYIKGQQNNKEGAIYV